MRIGAVFSQADSGTDPDAIRKWAVDAEAAGFEHLMAYDHVLGASTERLGPGPFGNFPKAPYTSEHTFHEILVLFSHLAALTTRMSFITSVLVLPQRQTAVVAKQIASIDLLSGGRIRLAVGVGWNAAEYEALGVDFADRTAMLEEQIDVMRLLWSQPIVDFDGRFHHLRGVGINPLPTHPVADPDRQRRIRCGVASGRAQGRRMDAAVDPRPRPDRHRNSGRQAAPVRGGGRTRSRNVPDPRPRLHRAGLAGPARPGVGTGIRRLQHRLQPDGPARSLACRAPSGDCRRPSPKSTSSPADSVDDIIIAGGGIGGLTAALSLHRNGDRLDADRDGTSGGTEQADFRTLPLTRIQGTDVWGYVYDSYNRNPNGSNIPIVGATIRVDAIPEANAVTDENGYFILLDMPAPAFFVHVDGTTAINAPPGTIYPSVGKPFHSVPGQSTQLNMQGVPFNVYLPPMSVGDIQPLSATEDTVVGFGAGGLAELAAMFPEVDPTIWQQVEVTYPASSAIDEQGNVATQAIILPVPPNRIPAPLPPNLNPKLVISVQAMGATNFDVPAPVTFPNLDGLAPGEKSLIFSFNHDAGHWDVIGTGTVSTDGLMLVSDPGVGILAPGWHFTDPSTDHDGEVQEPTPKLDTSLGSAAFELARQAAAQFLNGIAALASGVDTFFPGVGQIPLVDQGLNTVGEEVGVLADVIDDGMIGADTFASLGLALAGTLDPDPVTGSYLDFAGFVLDVASLQQSTENTAEAFVDFAQALANAFTDWERTIIDLANETGVWVANMDKFLSGLEDIRAARTAANAQATSDPAIVAQFIRGFESILDARRFFTEQSPFSAEAALRDIQAGYVQFMEDFAKVYMALFQPTSGTSYTVTTTGGTVVVSGTTDGAGKFNAALPPNQILFITFTNPLKGQVITNVIVTGPSGSSSSSRTFLVPIVGTDTDGEGLFDEAERVFGTSPTLADTDGDGLNDRAEIEQGLDPLSNLAFPTGIIASLPLLGEAREVVVEGSTLDAARQTAYVATGSHGLAIVDSSVFNNPIVMGQLDLPGEAVDVAIDSRRQIAAVAAGSGGLHLVNVADPVQPALLRSVAARAAQVEVFEGVAYVAAGTKLQSFSLATGELLQTLNLGGGLLTGLAREDALFVTMDDLRNLRAVDISSGVMTVRGVLRLPQGGSQVFVGNGVAYAAARPNSFGGFVTVDVSDPDVLTLISGSDVTPPMFAPGTAVVANGSGLGVVVGGRNGALALDVLDISDPQLTNVFLSRVPLSVEPWSIALAGGIAFVADGTAGLQVVNFLAFRQPGTGPGRHAEQSRRRCRSRHPGRSGGRGEFDPAPRRRQRRCAGAQCRADRQRPGGRQRCIVPVRPFRHRPRH